MMSDAICASFPATCSQFPIPPPRNAAQPREAGAPKGRGEGHLAGQNEETSIGSPRRSSPLTCAYASRHRRSRLGVTGPG